MYTVPCSAGWKFCDGLIIGVFLTHFVVWVFFFFLRWNMAQNNTIHAELLLLLVLILTLICFTLSPYLQWAVLRMGWRGGCFSVRWRLLQRLLRSCGLLQTEKYCSKPASPIRGNISLSSLGFQLSELNGIFCTCDVFFQAVPKLMERTCFHSHFKISFTPAEICAWNIIWKQWLLELHRAFGYKFLGLF